MAQSVTMSPIDLLGKMLIYFDFVVKTKGGGAGLGIKFCLSSKARTKLNLSLTNNPLKLMFGNRV